MASLSGLFPTGQTAKGCFLFVLPEAGRVSPSFLKESMSGTSGHLLSHGLTPDEKLVQVTIVLCLKKTQC